MVHVGDKLLRHPWDKWLLKKRGEQTILVHKRDYNCQTYAMTVQIRSAARKRNLAISLHVEESRRGSVIVITLKGRAKAGRAA
jgi:hypothetical protein